MGNLDDMLAGAGIGGEPDDYATPPGHRSGFVSIVGRPNTGKSTLTRRSARMASTQATGRTPRSVSGCG